eukprot:5276574-Amphidinium_carterae.1
MADAQRAESELRIKVDYDTAIQRMRDLYIAGVRLISSFPDVADLVRGGISLLSLRTRNARINVAKPTPYLADIPVASSWTKGTVIVETPSDIWMKQAVRSIVDMVLHVQDWTLYVDRANSGTPGRAPGGCIVHT